MASIFKRMFGSGSEAVFEATRPIVDAINKHEAAIMALSDEALKAKTLEFKSRLAKGESLDDILSEAFAVVREAAKRTLGQRHFDVQLAGGIVLHKKNIAEMKTGEGKTLVATSPIYLNALTAKGVHLVTVNDYLAERDAVWMGKIYNFLGLSVGVIAHDASYVYDPAHTGKNEKPDATDEEKAAFHIAHEFLRPVSRRDAYHADITYGTNSEFGFDYLRDNLEYGAERLRQREPHFAIVDEIDSILIDEARTPLIISAPSGDSEEFYKQFARVAASLVEGEDYEKDEKHRSANLTDAGITKAEKMLGIENIYTEKGIKYVHHLETAVKAKALYRKDKEYVVKAGEIIIVDEFTGRLQPGRRWSEGLHQAIEAKEGVPIQKESKTYASITYQNYFRLYPKIAGMTGTARTSAEEFRKVYLLEVVEMPTHRPVSRLDKNDLVFQTEKGKFQAIIRKVKELNQKGQPVLIGTASIEKNELLSAYLRTEGVKHEILNAKNHEREGEIIAQAGRYGAVTIATNMAGRGVDIKLGGIPSSEENYGKVRSAGGLFVLGTERHEARRIDNQLRGRSGRQGDPGETQFFVSLEDSLMRVFANDMIKNMMGRFGIPEDEAIENRLITRSLETAQTRIEGFNFDARKQVLEFDDVMNAHRKTIYARRRKILTGTDTDVWDEFLSIVDRSDGDFMQKIEVKKKEMGEAAFIRVLRTIYLQTIDLFWLEHLEAMDYLRGSVNLRAYGQRDPLVEYKKEGLHLFRQLEISISGQVIELMTKLAPSQGAAFGANTAPVNPITPLNEQPAVSSTGEKFGRNDKVIVEKDGEKKEIKFKKLGEYAKDGWKVVA
jgi:preprotein translocase subunit SecA